MGCDPVFGGSDAIATQKPLVPCGSRWQWRTTHFVGCITSQNVLHPGVQPGSSKALCGVMQLLQLTAVKRLRAADVMMCLCLVSYLDLGADSCESAFLFCWKRVVCVLPCFGMVLECF